MTGLVFAAVAAICIGGVVYEVRSTKYRVPSTEYRVPSTECGVRNAEFDIVAEVAMKSGKGSINRAK